MGNVDWQWAEETDAFNIPSSCRMGGVRSGFLCQVIARSLPGQGAAGVPGLVMARAMA